MYTFTIQETTFAVVQAVYTFWRENCTMCLVTIKKSVMFSHGCQKGRQGGQAPPWILKLFAKKGCSFNFEW